ncbi:polyprenyl synthetase family protein [Anaerobranca gottschalkii]|uniref:Heptaprenyl diphosphate synthase n=1 Tax=Anaerobranca gottschalkii DSM 13577 TaxID=1120990 RepID=A0A1H9YTC5_9FIRM|nr:polyprenyl synthetase family protein [Anaerobranca gottschalkii]SES72407.1 heptaprenyl diphosphate synthase [Anaerobranca gottschalkii DSM 13577]
MQQILLNKGANIEQILGKVQELLIEVCKSNSQYCNYLTEYLLNRGGKRLRPLLVILIGKNNNMDELVKVAAASELIHTASLVHDDIVDNSPLRRGIQTINSRWNNSVAVLVGDFLFAKAFELLCEIKQGEILSHYTKAISYMSIGELEQLKNRFNPGKTVEQYYLEIYGKTGVLIATCCKAGGILRDMSQNEVNNLTVYGTEVGYAFQIMDDILDIKGNENTLGKPIFNDLKEGNITLPLILLLQKMSNRGLVEEIIVEKRFTENNLKFIYNMLSEYNIIELCLEIAKNHIQKALMALDKIEDCNEKNKLKKIAEFILTRNY